MGVFDDLDEKAKELAAKARAALDNPDEFLAKARERVEGAVGEAKEELEEFASDAREELKGLRERVADLMDCDGAKAEPAPVPEPPKAAAEPEPDPAPAPAPPEAT